jgi:(2Fe-2S) ferredoxin
MLKDTRYLFVCTNRRASGNPKGSCADKGSEELAIKLKAAIIDAGGRGKVHVCTSSCLHLCATGVSILQEPEHIAYGHVTLVDLPEIATAAVRGEVVVRLVVPSVQAPG